MQRSMKKKKIFKNKTKGKIEREKGFLYNWQNW